MEVNESKRLEFNELLIKAINHDIRRKILLELFDKGWAGYSELKKSLNLSTGVFYHHIRLLEEANLVSQSLDRTYEITPRGVQTINFLRQNFPQLTDSIISSYSGYYTIFSTILSSYPLLAIMIQLFVIIFGSVLLGMTYSFNLIGFFIVSSSPSLTSTLVALSFTFLNLIILFLCSIFLYGRLIDYVTLGANILFPQTIAVITTVIFGLLPFFPALELLSPLIGVLFSLVFQTIGLTYFLHFLYRSNAKSLEKIVVIMILIQYWTLLLLYLLT